MARDVDTVRARFEIRVTGQMRGAAPQQAGLCDDWHAHHPGQGDQEMLHLALEVGNQGTRPHHFRWDQFTLEDSEQYMIDAVAPDDALDCELEPGARGAGGLLFPIYHDLLPVSLWFDTGETYHASRAPMLIDFSLGDAPGDRRPTWKESVAADYDRQMGEQELEGGQVAPLFETREMMETISRRLGRPYRRLENGYLFNLALPDERLQNVMMSFSGRDEEGEDLIRFLTLCAPADDDGANHDLFLRMNPGLSYGAIGITTIGDEAFYVVTNTQLAATADPEELIKSITHLARTGDELENRLTGGSDIR